MTSTVFVKGFAALVAVGLVVGILELSCLASERRVAAPTTLFTGAIEPEIPIASEVESGEPAKRPALTF
ncbi:MAG: hypothetical protein HYU25_16990 [Candidatus Rokubacteria bacterium]|nr:hypothetical protein [Candidatus Rokubacteria bacterium]